jgi:hypothetical protein
MKQFLLLSTLLILATRSISQDIESSQPVTKEDFLKKSKGQKTAGFVFLGIGATALAIAAQGNVDFDTLGALVVLGGVSTLCSIPLFIGSGRNKRKANAMTGLFKIEKEAVAKNATLVYSYYPSIALRLRL